MLKVDLFLELKQKPASRIDLMVMKHQNKQAFFSW